jgi:hypothetical protein
MNFPFGDKPYRYFLWNQEYNVLHCFPTWDECCNFVTKFHISLSNLRSIGYKLYEVVNQEFVEYTD